MRATKRHQALARGIGHLGHRRQGRPFAASAVRLSVLAVALLMAAAPSLAMAKDSEPTEGIIVQLAAGEMVVDLGAKQGLPSAATVSVYRRLEVKHPVSGKAVIDRFLIGDVRVSELGALLSIVNDYTHLKRSPAVGDFVVYYPSSAPAARDSAATSGTGSASAQPVVVTRDCPEPPAPRVIDSSDPELAALDIAYSETMGKDFDRREDIWLAYLRQNPRTRYVGAITREVNWLREQAQVGQQAQPELAAAAPDTLTVRVAIPSAVPVDGPLEFNASIVEQEKVDRVRIFLAHPNDPGFEPVLLERDGNFNWRASLPDAWREVGSVDYFVEAIRTDGVATPVYGSSSSPKRFELEAVTRDAVNEKGRSRASVVFEFVDFWLDAPDGQHTDQYWRFESDFRYVVDFSFLHAFSIGVGVFDGSGGPTEQLDAQGALAPASLSRNISYGMAELEFAFHEYFGIAGRLSLGNGHVDDGRTSQLLIGGRVAARLGKDDETRLQFGGNFASQVGNEGWIELVLEEIDNLPISAGVVATNLPVGEDIGVSLNAGIGYQIADWAAVSVRSGWNARNIRHYGLTIGTGVVLTW